MELLPLGPVLFVDTAGVDDEGALGELRMQRTRAVLDRVDLGVVVTEARRVGRVRGQPARPNSSARKRAGASSSFNKTDLRRPPATERGAARGTARVPSVASRR